MRDVIDLDVGSLLREFELYENPPSQKQKSILEAAETLFSERGFDASSTKEIARRANTTERTLFKHFPSKRDLLRRVVFGVLAKTLLPMQIRQVRKFTKASYQSFQELIFAFGEDRVETGKTHGAKLKILVMELLQNEGFRAQFAKLWRRHIWSDFVKAVERFQKEGSLRNDVRPEALAQVSLLVIAGFVATRHLLKLGKVGGGDTDLQVLLEVLFEGLNPR
ncbi:MAG: TetR/AcrR family transcriptional regulator [Bdellovibrionales bacterium]|nr:TetR/AcrR family transcriptional regulator [Bdellovibrionales bacterium]